MSNLATIAKQIPDEYRKELLELNIIDIAVPTDLKPRGPMHYLITIWTNYIERDFEPNCPLCTSRVWKNFKALKKELIKLEKDHNLLKSV